MVDMAHMTSLMNILACSGSVLAWIGAFGEFGGWGVNTWAIV